MAPLAANLTTWVVDSAIATATILFAGRVLLCFIHRPAARQRVAELTLAACLIAPLLACVPGWPRFSLGLITADTPVTAMVQTRTPQLDILAVDNPGGPNKIDVPHAANTPIASSTLDANHRPHVSIPWLSLILPAYIGGMLLATLRLAMGHISLWRLKRTAQIPDAAVQSIWWRIIGDRRAPGAMLLQRSLQQKHGWLMMTDRLSRPISFGILTPIVLIPTNLCRKAARRELIAVLRHEAVHVARCDGRSWAIASLVQILFFYQPLYWWLRRDLRVAQEYIADACAAGNFPSPAAYAQQLLQVLRQTNSHAGLLTASGAVGLHSEFFIRMRHLLNHHTIVEPRCSRWFSAVAGVALLAISIAATAMTVGGGNSLRPAAPSQNPQSTSLAAPDEAERRGMAFLLSQQDSSGAWLPRSGPAMTALVVKALIQAGHSVNDIAVRRGLAFIDHLHQPDHGYYLDSSPAYNTAIVLGTLALLPGDAYEQRIADGRHFLQALPALTPVPQNNPWYAPASHNTDVSLGLVAADPSDAAAWTVEAFHDTGAHANEAIVRASLNHVVTTFNPDPTERTAGTVLQNYGALTYAQLKSMLYAGLTRDDPRVQLAIRWIRQNYTLDANPADTGGRGQFFYYHTLAKALSAYGENPITDARGTRHDWKAELRDRLAALQNADGSWINQKVGDYLENNPVVVTTYGVLALQETRK